MDKIIKGMKCGCTKRGYDIYDHLMSFNMEFWDQRK